MKGATLICIALWLGAQPFACEASADARHRVRIEGGGSATVVFEAGLGDTLDSWRAVQDEVAANCARTMSYNRAGYPGSGRAHAPRDAKRVVDELRTELRARGLAPPYVLVGHSLGGLYMQYFARNFPAEVQGLLLVDATHWQQLQRMKAETPGMYGTVKALSLLMTGTLRQEMKDSVDAGTQVAASPAPGPIPTIVLSSTRAAPGETPAFRSLLHRLQNEEAELYSARQHEFVARSGHYIQRDRPEVVVQAIRELAGCT